MDKGTSFLAFMMLLILVGCLTYLLWPTPTLSQNIDNDPQLGFCWSPPAQWPEIVAWYELKVWLSGFSPPVDSVTTAGPDTFVVWDATPYMPYLTGLDSMKVRGYNTSGESGHWSAAGDSVAIALVPGTPSAPWWVPENE